MSNKPRVLLVDDDRALASMISLTLSLEDMDVKTARNGREALEDINAETPDVVVMDLTMPEMDGWTLYRRIRDSGNHVPVLLISGAGAQDACKVLGAERALEKPFDPDDLVVIVEELLGERRDG